MNNYNEAKSLQYRCNYEILNMAKSIIYKEIQIQLTYN